MDDILIHTRSDLPYHRTRVHQILDKLHKHDLFLKPEKCVFEQKEVEFLGVILGHNTIRMDPAKGQEVAKLYYDNVYRWFGLPSKVISDRDPRFTSFFAKALAQQLGIKQNVSSAFHP
jgi:hypothetical protein